MNRTFHSYCYSLRGDSASENSKAERASQQGLEKVDQKRRINGWNKDAPAWLDAANDLLKATGGNVSRSSLQRFWKGEAILKENFVAICKAVGIQNWEEIVDESPVESSDNRVSTEELISDVSDANIIDREELLRQKTPLMQSEIERFCTKYIARGNQRKATIENWNFDGKLIRFQVEILSEHRWPELGGWTAYHYIVPGTGEFNPFDITSIRNAQVCIESNLCALLGGKYHSLKSIEGKLFIDLLHNC